MDMRPEVRVHIEELVLDGFAPGDRYRIGEAVERELARLLGAGGPPGSLGRGRALARLDAGAFEVTPDSSAAEIGSRVARAVHGGLTA